MYEPQTPSNFGSLIGPAFSPGTSPSRRNTATDADRVPVVTSHEKPCLFQANPRPEWQLPDKPRNRSHSASVRSRYNWAAKQAGILDINHRDKRPQFIATIKFSEVKTIPEIRSFHKNLNRSLQRRRKKFENDELVFFLVREIDPTNKIHMHLLIIAQCDLVIIQVSRPLARCMRFSACWKTMLWGLSIASSVTSRPRLAGRSCMKRQSAGACASSSAET
jgi:hypothetical protein